MQQKLETHIQNSYITTRSWLLCILRATLTFKYNLPDMQIKWSQFHNLHVQKKKKKKTDVWIWNQSQVDAYPHSLKIQTKFNELSSSFMVTFPLPFLHILQPSFTLPPFLFFTHYRLPPTPPPLAQFFILNPLLRLHLFLSSSKTTAIPERGPSIFFNETRVRGSAKARADYYLSLPPLNTG